jgi:hypothetical protein
LEVVVEVVVVLVVLEVVIEVVLVTLEVVVGVVVVLVVFEVTIEVVLDVFEVVDDVRIVLRLLLVFALEVEFVVVLKSSVYVVRQTLVNEIVPVVPVPRYSNLVSFCLTTSNTSMRKDDAPGGTWTIKKPPPPANPNSRDRESAEVARTESFHVSPTAWGIVLAH